MQEKRATNLHGTIQNIKRLFIIVAAIFLFTVGCQDNQPDDRQQVDTDAVGAETAVPPEAATLTEPEAVPEINIEPLPANINLVGDVLYMAAEETAVTDQIALNTPEDTDAALLDLYGWDGTSWVFVPSQYDPATQQRYTANQNLFQAVALVQVEAQDEITVGGVWSEAAESETASAQFTEAVVSTLHLGADGELEGSLLDAPAGLANAYVQLTNVGDGIDTDALSAFLADESAQAAQIEAVLELAESYTGVSLNYQGVEADQKEAFTTFVQTLSDALAAQEKKLILTLPAPLDTDEVSGLDAYWITLAGIADTIYLQLPLDPHGYGEDGTVDRLLAWATDNIDRRKLVALIPSNPVAKSGDTWIALSAEEQLGHFGEIEFVSDAAQFEPEAPVEAALSGDVSPLQWDETTSAYHYTVDGAQDVWLVHPATVAVRMETAVKHNLQGIAFSTPTQLPDVAQSDEPAIIWTVLDDADNVVITESGSETSFSWEGAAEPGEFTLQVEFVSGDKTTSLGALPITIAAAEETEEVAESDEDTEAVTGILKVNANVRIGPGESFEKFPGPVLRDTEVELLGRDEFGYWLYIAFSNIDGEQTGWIAASLVDVDPAFDISTLEDATEIVAAASETTVAEAPAPAAQPTPAATTPAAAPPSGPPPPVSAPPVAVGGFELGGQTHSFSNPTLMASAGMTWVKFQHKWGEGGNPNDLAGRINNAHAAGFKVLLSIPGANTYPESINFGEYIQFLAGVAALGPDAIEVWNEMNIDFEWPAGQIDPASYVNNMLAPAYNAIKAANPNVMVISGAPAPTGFDNNTNAWADNRYMAGMLAAGAASYADCIGAHYNAGASSPSTVSGHPTGSAHYSWYLLPTLNVYAQLGKPVCFTELGYLSGDDYGGVPERFAWAAGTTVAQHAAWLAEAVSVAANTGKVRMIIVFNVDFTHYGDDPQAGYAMIRQNGGCPACETLAGVMGR